MRDPGGLAVKWNDASEKDSSLPAGPPVVGPRGVRLVVRRVRGQPGRQKRGASPHPCGRGKIRHGVPPPHGGPGAARGGRRLANVPREDEGVRKTPVPRDREPRIARGYGGGVRKVLRPSGDLLFLHAQGRALRDRRQRLGLPAGFLPRLARPGPGGAPQGDKRDPLPGRGDAHPAADRQHLPPRNGEKLRHAERTLAEDPHKAQGGPFALQPRTHEPGGRVGGNQGDRVRGGRGPDGPVPTVRILPDRPGEGAGEGEIPADQAGKEIPRAGAGSRLAGRTPRGRQATPSSPGGFSRTPSTPGEPSERRRE